MINDPEQMEKKFKIKELVHMINTNAGSAIYMLFLFINFCTGVYLICEHSFTYLTINVGLAMILNAICLSLNTFWGYSKRCIMISYYLLILTINLKLLYNGYETTTPTAGLRFMYILAGSTIILGTMKMDSSLKELAFLILLQMGVICVMMYFYGYKTDRNQMFLDIIFFLQIVAAILINFVFKKVFMSQFDRFNSEIQKHLHQYQNLFTTMINPIISINFSSYEITFNQRFKDFIANLENEDNKDQIDFLFNFKTEENNNNMSVLLDNAKTKKLFKNFDKNFQEIFRRYSDITFASEDYQYLTDDDFLTVFFRKNPTNAVMKITFFKKIEILNVLFNEFVEEIESHISHSKTENGDNLIFQLIKSKSLNELTFKKTGTYKTTIAKGDLSEDVIIELLTKSTIFKNEGKNEKIIDLIINDISHIRKREIDKQIETEMRVTFLAKVAHEFKTPINSLIYIIQQTLSKINKGEKVLEEDLIFIQSQANYINVLIQDINDYSKDVKELSVELVKVELREITTFCFNILKALILRNNMGFDILKPLLEMDDNLPKYIYTDEKRLKQVLVNLLSNASKFCTFGHIKLSVKSLYNNKEISFTVEDTGIGIKKDQMDKLYKEFSMLDVKKGSLKNKDGSGLGLSICKKIIDKIGKNLTCESNENCTRFMFTVLNNRNRRSSQNFDSESIITVRDRFIPELVRTDLSSEKSSEKSLIKKSFSLLKIHEEIECGDSVLQIEKLASSHNIIKRLDDASLIEALLKEETDDIKVKKSLKETEDILQTKEESFLWKLMNDINLSFYKNIFLLYTRPLFKFLRIVSSARPNKELYSHSTISLKTLTERKKFILIVDDEGMNLKSIKKQIKTLLKERGVSDIQIITAKDGIEALFILLFDINLGKNFRMIITDHNMKFLDGKCFINNLNNLTQKNVFHDVKLVLYSAENIDNNFNNKNPHVTVLSKPCERKKLVELFEKINFLR